MKAVDILIFNDKKELLLQMRAAGDKSFPSHWDFSVGGHVEKSEEFQEAAEREVFEELAVKGDLKFVTRELFRYHAWNSKIMRRVDASIFKMTHNCPFTIDLEEVQKVEFFTLPIIQKMIDDGEKFHPEFLLAWQRGITSESGKIASNGG